MSAEPQEDLMALRAAAETACMAVLPMLPIEGSWEGGYRVSERIQAKVVALPDEWADAAHAVIELLDTAYPHAR